MLRSIAITSTVDMDKTIRGGGGMDFLHGRVRLFRLHQGHAFQFHLRR